MPKLIENLEEKILEETKKQILDKGLDGVTIRSISEQLDVAVGTIYNYFPSKDSLVSKLLLRDWDVIFEEMRSSALKSKTVRECLVSVASNYAKFSKEYLKVLTNFHFEEKAKYAFSERHSLLVNVLSQVLKNGLENIGVSVDEEITWMFSELVIDVNNENRESEPYIKYFESLIKGNK